MGNTYKLPNVKKYLYSKRSIVFVSFAWERVMGKTQLHTAARNGDFEKLQRLLDSGSYDVNEGDEDLCNVCEEREREREREVLTYSFFLLISTLRIAMNNSGYKL
jgi:hypothetical protein